MYSSCILSYSDKYSFISNAIAIYISFSIKPVLQKFRIKNNKRTLSFSGISERTSVYLKSYLYKELIITERGDRAQ